MFNLTKLYKFSFMFLKYYQLFEAILLNTYFSFGGTGSEPCVPQGWHFEIRFKVKTKPLNGP